MTIPLFPRLAALGIFFLSSGFLSAASNDTDAVPDVDNTMVQSTNLIPQPTPSPSQPASVPQASAATIPGPVVDALVIPEVARGYEDIYRRFLGGKLIYTDPNGIEKKELPIRALANPLKGTFDLSECGDTSQYLSISTGYRKAQKAANSSKVEIWLAPWFLVNKNLSSSANHLQPIMGNWDAAAAPVGLLWTWGGWSDLARYDYLVTNSLEDLGSEDMHEKWKKSGGWLGGSAIGDWIMRKNAHLFQVSFDFSIKHGGAFVKGPDRLLGWKDLE